MKKLILTAVFMLLIITISYADIIIPDDYATIQAGINAATAGDTVKVKYGTYNEAITINKDLTLIKYSTQMPTITYSYGSMITIQSAEVLISGFNVETTAQYGYGMRVYGNQDVVIDDCIVSGMYKGIFSEQIQIEIYNCQFYDNHKAITITTNIEESEYPAVIKGCSIYQNEAGIDIDSNGGPLVLIEECDIYENELNGILLEGGCSTIKRCIISDNIYNNNGYGIDCISGYCDIINCTIHGNYKGVRFISNIGKEIINSILWGNSYADIVGSPTVTYSCIEDGYAGNGNIDDDPQFEDAANGDFHLRWDNDELSPCIDTGDQNTEWDGDDTPPDMGRLRAEKHWYDNWELPDINTNRGWKWMCFPVIDTVTNSQTYVGDMAEYMLADILDTDLLDHVEWVPIETTSNNIINIEFEDPIWTNTNHIFTSIQGYKFQMLDDDPVYLPISGFLEDSTKTIQLNDEHDNWMGYFIDYEQNIEDAFGEETLENLYYIQTQRWTVTREEPEPESPWLGLSSANRTLNYGDLVIVRCFDDELFAWCDTELEQERDVREDTQYFNYEEQADYIPIYVQLDPTDLPTEIAVFVDGECKGAEKVLEDLTDIRAYMLGANGGNITFEMYFDNKSPIEKVSKYFVYNTKSMEFEPEIITVNPSKDYYLVTFKETDTPQFTYEYKMKHYPNPVRSNTKIKYSLPRTEKVTINIYNVRGQLIQTLINDQVGSGIHTVYWDGTDLSGKYVNNGVYMYVLKTNNKTIAHKMLLMR